MLFIAFYQAFDAVQVMTAFILRAYKIALVPTLIYAVSLWGIGLGGGYVLGFGLIDALPAFTRGAAGFWLANSISLAIAGSLLVFTLSASSFVTPNLLGGSRIQVLAASIYRSVTQTLDWPFAAAQAVILFVGILLILVPYARLAGGRSNG